MDDQQTFSGRSANSRQKQTITTSINNFLGDQSIRDLGWTWDRIAANRIPGSTIDQMHRSASIYLSSLVRQPPFMSIRAANSIPQNAVFLVDETGRLYYSWPNVSSAGEHTTDWFSRIDITDHFSGIATFNEDMTLLAKMAKLSGGWVVTGDKIVVSQWLRLHQLPLPANEQSARELLELIDFATLPDAPRFSNYWQLLDTPEDSPFNLTEHKRAIIRQVTETFKGGYLTLVDAFGEHLRLESTSADKLPTSLAYRLPRLIEIAAWSSNQGQAYLDALGWFTDASGPRASPEFIEQLLIAAMLLDLDPEANGAGTTFAGFDLYSPSYVQAQPSQVGTDLQTHLAERFKLDTLLAPLIAEMVLAGLAPQYLVRDVPSTLYLGTPGWVVLTQAVNLAENLVAGSSRVMTYEHLLRFSPASDLTPQFQSLHADLNVDPVLTWALMNGVVRRNADGSLDQEAVSQAIQHYNQYSDMLAKALRDINEPIPRRKALALKELQARVPDCDPQELLVKHRGSRTGGGAKVSVLDLYMSDQLHTQDWGRIRGADIYQSFPGLTELYPVSGLYESAIHNHYNRVKEAFSIHIRFIFAQMEQSNRRFIEHGRLGIYRVEQYQSHVGKGIPQASPARTARYGLILCAELGASLVRCFELFPLQSLCRDSPELRDDVGQHLFSYYEGSTTRADFVQDNGLVNAPLDSDAYFQNSAPREGQTSTVFVRKIGEFDAAFHASQSASPVRYFHS